MSDYKKTLNIPQDRFPMKANLTQNANYYQEKWKKLELYKNSRKRNSKNPKFIIHDGPPYANGNIHVGHALNKILKDFICRYKSSTGCLIEYIPGWDTHGLPIENKIEKIYSPKELNTIEKKRKYCREYANSQIELQKSQFLQLHLFSSFDDTYKTFSPEYIKKEYEILLELFKKSLINWDLKPVSWSWSSKTALAESEIIYKNIKEDSIYFFFKSFIPSKEINRGINILIWTTTPYTLEANKALAIHPEIIYLLFIYNSEYYLIAKNRYHIVSEIFKWENTEIIGEWSGKIFVNSEYINPITKEKNRIISATYLTDSSGTGIVHIAPGFGLEDYYEGIKNELEVYCPIDERGYFYTSKFPSINSLFYKDASSIIIKYLDNEKYLVKLEPITHSIGHDWRTDKPLIYRATRQWFLNLNKIKSLILSNSFSSKPVWIKKKLEELILNREEWCLSRQRSWGIPIPILFSDNTPILDIEQIEHTISLINKYGVESWYEKEAIWFLHSKYSKEKNYQKSTDILDVWFDSGSSWKIISEKSADIYLEGFDQLRGWFNSSSIISLFSQKLLPFKKIIAHGFILDEKGNKMSKSLGNVVDPLELVKKYGADILRLWIAKSNYLEDIRFSEKSIQETISLYRKIRNTLFRYPLSIIPDHNYSKVEYQELKFLENQYIWLLWEEKYQIFINSLESYNFSFLMLNITSFIKIYSSWYLEITKDILYCSDKTNERYLEICKILWNILETITDILSVIIPQTAEEVYQYLKKPQESIFLRNWEHNISKNSDNKKLEEFKKFLELKERIYIEIEKLKEEKKISGSWQANLSISENLITNFPHSDLKYILNIGEIKIEKNTKDQILITPTLLPLCQRCKKHKKLEELKNQELCIRCYEIVEKNKSTPL